MRARSRASICQPHWPRPSGAALVPGENECSARASRCVRYEPDLSTSSAPRRALVFTPCLMRHARTLQSRFAWGGLNVVAAAADACQGRWRDLRADQARKFACHRAHGSDAGSAHAESRARSRRAVPLPRRHGEVHRLQVLRRRVQRAERQPCDDQLAARRGDRRRLVSHDHALVSLDGVQSLPRADVPAGLPR